VIPVWPITTLRFFDCAHAGSGDSVVAAIDIARTWLKVRRSTVAFPMGRASLVVTVS
jgi:hypothetical protein